MKALQIRIMSSRGKIYPRMVTATYIEAILSIKHLTGKTVSANLQEFVNILNKNYTTFKILKLQNDFSSA